MAALRCLCGGLMQELKIQPASQPGVYFQCSSCKLVNRRDSQWVRLQEKKTDTKTK